VFGRVLTGSETLTAIKEIPVYSYKAKTGYFGQEKDATARLADGWFEAQKNYYVSMGKQLGDTRAVDMRGKILRRVVIKRVSVIDSN
jgi:hypothetical protein